MTIPKKGVGFDIHERAKEMRQAGFSGQGMDRPDLGGDAIVIAACDPAVEAEMDERGYALWWIINHKYRAFLARKKLGEIQQANAPANDEVM